MRGETFQGWPPVGHERILLRKKNPRKPNRVSGLRLRPDLNKADRGIFSRERRAAERNPGWHERVNLV
jgi:hypothetical protein